MIRWIRKSLGAVVRRILSRRWIRILRRPALLPSYYKEIAGDIEPIFDLQEHPEWMDDEYWAAMLRKYAHIMDKGLWACDFQPGRGRVYRDSAAEAYDHIQSDAVRNDPSVKWAAQKILQYDQGQQSEAGYHSSAPPELPSSTFDDLSAIILSRRSIRSFQERPVDDHVITKIADLASWAPSSCNKQTIVVFATNAPALASQCLGTCKGGTCFSEYVPGFVSFCADLRSYAMPQEAWLPQVDVGLAAQNCSLAASTLGLSMTMLSWCQHDAGEDKRLRRLLDIPGYYRITLNAVVGYPATSVETPERKSLATTFILRKAGGRKGKHG